MERIKKDDVVIVTAGKSKGHIGKVLSVTTVGITVEGANVAKKHVKAVPQLQKPGEVQERPMPIHSSNVALYNPATKKGSRVGFRYLEENGKKQKVRYFKSNNELVDVSA